MKKDTEKLENTSEEPVKPLRDENGRLLPNQVSLNPKGRPVGSLDFKTKWIAFIEKIAEQNGITTDEVDKQLLTVAYKQMQSGDFRYWKDIQDRVYGTAIQKVDTTSNGETIIGINYVVPNGDKS